MKMAQDSLQKQGINLKLYTYDTSADTMSVKAVLNKPELKQMDLIIGPIYKSAAKVASRYAQQNDINIVNPLSQDLEMAKGLSNVFLFEASVATQARQAATYAYQNFTPKSAIILFESAKEDTTFAYHYRQQFLKLGGKVKVYKKFNSAQSSATATLFRGLNLQEVGHMAVFSDKMTAAVNATSLLQSNARELPLITYDKWLDINQITLRQLDDLQIYFVSPKHVDKQSPTHTWFKKTYTNKYGLPPSQYAYSGFEMLYYFGQLLNTYGPQFNQQLSTSGIQPGVILTGVGYTNRSQAGHCSQTTSMCP
ncbi:hypothetical protein GCM10028895_13490 [Pontibacter rugosus]